MPAGLGSAPQQGLIPPARPLRRDEDDGDRYHPPSPFHAAPPLPGGDLLTPSPSVPPFHTLVNGPAGISKKGPTGPRDVRQRGPVPSEDLTLTERTGPAVFTGSRYLTRCQGCRTKGKFRPLELMRRTRGAWEWRALLLCASCRSAVGDYFAAAPGAPVKTSTQPRREYHRAEADPPDPEGALRSSRAPCRCAVCGHSEYSHLLVEGRRDRCSVRGCRCWYFVDPRPLTPQYEPRSA